MPWPQISPEPRPPVKRGPLYVSGMVETPAGWVGPTGAIALVVIALAFAIIAGVALMLARVASHEVRELRQEMARIRAELSPALHALQRVADAGVDLSNDVREEVQQYLEKSRFLRKDLDRGVRRLKGRLAELDALYEVVHGEVEDTALDVAARLRSLRNGSRIVTRLRRCLVRGRRGPLGAWRGGSSWRGSGPWPTRPRRMPGPRARTSSSAKRSSPTCTSCRPRWPRCSRRFPTTFCR